MGGMVANDPKAAADELTRRMKANANNMGEVAKEYGVHRETLADWFTRLEAAGYPVAGRGAAKTGRKPGQKDEVPRRRKQGVTTKAASGG